MSTKRKALSLAKPVVKPSAKVATRSKIDETRTAVSTGPAPKSATKATAPETIEISSDSSSHYSGSDNEEDVNSDNEEEAVDAAPEKKQTTTTTTEPTAQQDQENNDNDNDDDDDASPTFGDLARGNATIDVASALAAQQEASSSAAAATKNNTITVQRPNGTATTISATSLGTVLNQALRTDDSDLLESCLQTSDPKIITNTITRMDSALAGVLLSKLAARMHRRPGRAFGLMKWIQTTLVAHGGSLVAQPEVVARLGELNRVLEERARGLPALLALKGKLDMLDQQMRWRKFVKQGGAAKEEQHQENEEEEEEEDVDEPGVVYVEGDEETGTVNGTMGNEEDFALIDVGANGESDEEEGDEDEEDDEEDDEEFDDGESLDEDEVDHDDVEESGDEDEDDEEEEDDAPPAKVQKTSSKFAKRK
ncbi:Dip2/Utp12 family-domain-containing protein [Neurospora hispaniola]|uniref:Dip2/Utp12 family-domain-containing protein n=1 Tax=Neurospora hispaniola TaxID=588809 RepID=A0AAJ0I706_9PEZI|nr:Dip2/Utp12 family-domain-containing protein [Neurospora hispaniola]